MHETADNAVFNDLTGTTEASSDTPPQVTPDTAAADLGAPTDYTIANGYPDDIDMGVPSNEVDVHKPHFPAPANGAEPSEFTSNTPHYHLSGELDTPGMVKQYSLYDQSSRFAAAFIPDLRAASTDVALTQEGQLPVLAAGNDIGLDLQSRLMPLDQYRYVDDQTQLDDIARQYKGEFVVAGGMLYLPHGGAVHVREEEKHRNVASVIASTLCHVAMRCVEGVVITDEATGKTKTVPQVSLGYQQRGDANMSGINSLARDMTGARAQQHAQRHSGSPDTSPILRDGPLAALGDAAVHETAKALDASPEAVARQLERGYFTGSTSGLRSLEAGLGTERLGGLLQVNTGSSFAEAASIADSLGLARATETIDDFMSGGGPLKVFDWLRKEK